MGDYGKLLKRIWRDPDFTSLDSRPQQTYFLLLSYPTRNNAGVVPLTVRRWANATADATVQNVTEALEVLVARNFIIVDWDTEEVLVRTYMRNDELYKQPNVLKSALNDVSAVESNALRRALLEELLRLPSLDGCKHTELVDLAAKRLAETVGEPQANPSVRVSEGQANPALDPSVGKGLGCVVGEGSYVTCSPTTATPTAPATAASTQPPSVVGSELALSGDARPAKRVRRTRMTTNWVPSEAQRQRSKEQYPNADLGRELIKFRDSHIAKGSLMADWDAAWRTWTGNMEQYGGGRPAAAGPSVLPKKGSDYQAMRDPE